MPFNKFPYPRKRSSVSDTRPFGISIVSVDVNSNQRFVKSSDFDCACPCNDFMPEKLITSSKLISLSRLLTDDTAPNSAHPKIALAVKVSPNSYLFKGIVTPTQFTKGQFAPLTTEDNPTVKIYGLNVPILLKDSDGGFLSAGSSTTLKLWLNCCFASGESTASTSGAKGFTSCVSFIENGDALTPCSYKGIFPQVCFIAAGTSWPEYLITRKVVNRGSETNPLYDRRAIQASVPICEVNVGGSVVCQYVKSNLTLSDICQNGTPVKFPMSVFSEDLVLPLTV